MPMVAPSWIRESLLKFCPLYICTSQVDLMVAVKLQTSKGQARKLIKGGGVYLNNQKVKEELVVVTEADLIDGRMLLVAAGKKNKMLVKLQ